MLASTPQAIQQTVNPRSLDISVAGKSTAQIFYQSPQIKIDEVETQSLKINFNNSPKETRNKRTMLHTLHQAIKGMDSSIKVNQSYLP